MATSVPAEPEHDLRELPSREEAHLYLQLQRFAFCLERHAAERAEPEPAGEGGDPDGDGADLVARIDLEIDALDSYLAEHYPDENLPLARLARRFVLDDVALRLLVAAAAPSLDLSLARQLEALAGRAQPDAGLLVATTTFDLAEERSALAALRATAPLVRGRLLRLGTNPAWSPETPLLHRPAMVPERVIDWLRGDATFTPERFEHAAVLRVAAARPTADDAAARVARALFRSDGERRLPLVVAGPALAGKAAAVHAAAETRGMPVLDVDIERVAASAQPVDLLLDLVREAMLHDAVLLLRRVDALDDPRSDLRRAITAVLADGALWVALTTRGAWRADAHGIPGAQLVEIDLPPAPEQLAIWQSVLPASVRCDPDALTSLASRYRLTRGDIGAAGAAAIRRAELGAPGAQVSLVDLEHAIHDRLRHRLDGMAELIATPLGWDDLVISEHVANLILELLASIRCQTQVMDTWGFGRTQASDRAVCALFSGPPGTGKTMVATLIAKELGLELFRVDLSRVVSSSARETESNLARIFDEATHAHAVLLFDDADVLFARHHDARSLHQRLDAFDGLVLFVTRNAPTDDALQRRLRFRIEFPIPDAAERAQLWQAMLPPEVPVAHDIDFVDLGQRHEMTGGYIKNAVVRAAYLAAGQQLPGLTSATLERAAHLEEEAMRIAQKR